MNNFQYVNPDQRFIPNLMKENAVTRVLNQMDAPRKRNLFQNFSKADNSRLILSVQSNSDVVLKAGEPVNVWFDFYNDVTPHIFVNAYTFYTQPWSIVVGSDIAPRSVGHVLLYGVMQNALEETGIPTTTLSDSNRYFVYPDPGNPSLYKISRTHGARMLYAEKINGVYYADFLFDLFGIAAQPIGSFDVFYNYNVQSGLLQGVLYNSYFSMTDPSQPAGTVVYTDYGGINIPRLEFSATLDRGNSARYYLCLDIFGCDARKPTAIHVYTVAQYNSWANKQTSDLNKGILHLLLGEFLNRAGGLCMYEPSVNVGDRPVLARRKRQFDWRINKPSGQDAYKFNTGIGEIYLGERTITLGDVDFDLDEVKGKDIYVLLEWNEAYNSYDTFFRIGQEAPSKYKLQFLLFQIDSDGEVVKQNYADGIDLRSLYYW